MVTAMLRRLRFAWVLSVLVVLAGELQAQCQRSRLLPSDLGEEDWFGYAVALDGEWAIVGSPLDDDVANQSGAAYAFRRINGAWVQTQKLKASDASFGVAFGETLALSGTRIVIGALSDSPQGVFAAGSAYVFELEGDTWVQRAKIWAQAPTPNTFFGESVDISGGRILVGSMQASPVALYSGIAWVFEGSGSSWTQVATLIPSDAAQGDGFGSAVAIDGTRLVVGAASADVPPLGDNGAAYVFESPAPGVWLERQKLVASDAASADSFAFRLALQSDTIVIGATGQDVGVHGSGAAYVFGFEGASWVQRQKLLPADPALDAGFGARVSIDADIALIGALSTGDLGGNSGSAYAFRRTGMSWVQIGKLLANDGAAGDLFGVGVAISGTTALAGALNADHACPTVPTCNSGAAY
jgi:hypothetical protein